MLQRGSVLLYVILGILVLIFAGVFYSKHPWVKIPESNKTPFSAQYQEASYAPEESGNAALANPASVNCIKQGGELKIEKRGDGGEYGVCNFDDNMSCEEWALMRGECPVGGVKITGFTTKPEIYCAILGGKTREVKNAKCTLPNGKICVNNDLYNGRCI